jgi:hypothetical protein
MLKHETLYPTEIFTHALKQAISDATLQGDIREYVMLALVHAALHIINPKANNPTGAVFALIGQMEWRKIFNESATEG